jgi:hypothetical protein
MNSSADFHPSWPGDSASEIAVSEQPSVNQPVAAPAHRWPIRSQVVVLSLVVISSVILGYAMFRSVAGIRLAIDGLADLSAWSWGIAGGAVATFVASMVSIVSLIRTQFSRLIPLIAVFSSLFLPPLALYIGFRWGFEIATVAVGNDVSSLVASTGGSSLMKWLLDLFGG